MMTLDLYERSELSHHGTQVGKVLLEREFGYNFAISIISVL